MLRHHSTYEIMRPEDVGLTRTHLVLGKHSGRHALRERVKQLGFELDELEFNRLFEEFKALADTKKELFDGDIEALVLRAGSASSGPWTLVSFATQARTGAEGTATVCLAHQDGRSIEKHANGDGPVDACFKAIEQAAGCQPQPAQVRSAQRIGGRGCAGRSAGLRGVQWPHVPWLQREHQHHRVERTRVPRSDQPCRAEPADRCETPAGATQRRAHRAGRSADRTRDRRDSHAHQAHAVHLVQRQARALGKGHGARHGSCVALRFIRIRRHSFLFDAARARASSGSRIMRIACSTPRRSIP